MTNSSLPPNQHEVAVAIVTLRRLLDNFSALKDGRTTVEGTFRLDQMARLIGALEENLDPALLKFEDLQAYIDELLTAYKPFMATEPTMPHAKPLQIPTTVNVAAPQTLTDLKLHPAVEMLSKLGLDPLDHPMYHTGGKVEQFLNMSAFGNKPDGVTMLVTDVRTIAPVGAPTVLLYALNTKISGGKISSALGYTRRQTVARDLFKRTCTLLKLLGINPELLLVYPSIEKDPGIRWFLDDTLANDTLRQAWEHVFAVMSQRPFTTALFQPWNKPPKSTVKPHKAKTSLRKQSGLFTDGADNDLPAGMSKPDSHFLKAVRFDNAAGRLIAEIVNGTFNSSIGAEWGRLIKSNNPTETSKGALIKVTHVYKGLGIDVTEPLPGLDHLGIIWFLTSVAKEQKDVVDFWTRVFTFFEGQTLTVDHFRPWNGVPEGMPIAPVPEVKERDPQAFPEPSADAMAWLTVLQELDAQQSGLLHDYIPALIEATGSKDWSVDRIQAAIKEAAQITRWLVNHCIEDGQTAPGFPTENSAGWQKIVACITKHSSLENELGAFWTKLLRFAKNRRMNTIDALYDPSQTPPPTNYSRKRVLEVTTATPHGGDVVSVKREE